MALYNQNLVELQALSSFDNVSTNSYTIQPVAAITCSVYIIQLMICMNKQINYNKNSKKHPQKPSKEESPAGSFCFHPIGLFTGNM